MDRSGTSGDERRRAAGSDDAPAGENTVSRTTVDRSGAGTVARTSASANSDTGATETEPQDSDGDGVPDGEDYAPRDPDVQERSDVTEAGDGIGTGSKPFVLAAAVAPLAYRRFG